MHPVFRTGARAIISGSASGVGFQIAKECATHGMKLGLIDVNKEGLEKAKESLIKSTDVETYNIDVGKLDEWNNNIELPKENSNLTDSLSLH